MTGRTPSRHTAKYDRIGQTYYDTAAAVRQEFESTAQRAQEKLRGLEERRQARERKSEQVATVREDEQRRQGRPKGAVVRLFGRETDKRAKPTVKSIRGAS
ncbi:MAG: hypothetical protein Q4E11_05845 [Corynebacterium sp.]|uniref:hypothetical protein n=1 Tax=Corynebacterium sp. TaxID=1720 RepID=UPI0026DB0DD9|nr:hypothetical protein [Corynebacterium sp.]MDO5030090.1 hypothetical protein [Corynebacterium sp.]